MLCVLNNFRQNLACLNYNVHKGRLASKGLVGDHHKRPPTHSL